MKTTIKVFSILFLALSILVHLFYEDSLFWNCIYFLKEDIILLLLFTVLPDSKDFWYYASVRACTVYMMFRLVFNILVVSGVVDFTESTRDDVTVYFHVAYSICFAIIILLEKAWNKENY